MFQKIPCTRVITDCTKFFFETLSSLVNQSITYSYFKSYNTFKAFVTVSCHISFTAVGWTECFRTSGSSTEWRKYSPPPPPPPPKKRILVVSWQWKGFKKQEEKQLCASTWNQRWSKSKFFEFFRGYSLLQNNAVQIQLYLYVLP